MLTELLHLDKVAKSANISTQSVHLIKAIFTVKYVTNESRNSNLFQEFPPLVSLRLEFPQ